MLNEPYDATCVADERTHPGGISPRRIRSPIQRAVGSAVLTTAILFVGLVFVHGARSSETQTWVRPFVFSSWEGGNDTFMGVRILGGLELKPVRIDGHQLAGLSGLAWDHDEQLLYALSDLGHLFHFRPRFTEGRLIGLTAMGAYALRDKRGRALKNAEADAEGLAIEHHRNGKRGDTRLIVSFERRPRILIFAPDGTQLGHQELPTPLRDPRNYVSRNKGLESVTAHADLGTLTAPEWPLANADDDFIPVYDMNGKSWLYPRAKAKRSALVALESMSDGSILTLERSFSFLSLHVVITLRRAMAIDASPHGGPLDVRDVAVFDSAQGWNVDNFEGLARHEDLRFFMVSDDNARAVQRTVLVYFELTDVTSEP